MGAFSRVLELYGVTKWDRGISVRFRILGKHGMAQLKLQQEFLQPQPQPHSASLKHRFVQAGCHPRWHSGPNCASGAGSQPQLHREVRESANQTHCVCSLLKSTLTLLFPRIEALPPSLEAIHCTTHTLDRDTRPPPLRLILSIHSEALDLECALRCGSVPSAVLALPIVGHLNLGMNPGIDWATQVWGKGTATEHITCLHLHRNALEASSGIVTPTPTQNELRHHRYD